MKDLKKLFWQLIIGKGIRIASKDLYEKRMNICRANHCGVYKNPMGLKLMERCGDCGCVLRVKTKIDESYIECPKGWW
jgi:hypothetical protein